MTFEALHMRGLISFRPRRSPPERTGAVGRNLSGKRPDIWRRALAFALIAWLGFGLGASDVLAHSRLVKSEPAARAVLAAAPKEVRLWFNEAIEIAFPRLLIARLPDNVPNGPVIIGFRVLSVDGHVIESQLAFTVNNPA